MPTLSLYQLDDQLAQIEDALLDADGEIDDETDAQFNALLDARDDKADAYISLIRTFETTADAYKAEADRLTANRRAAENAAKRLKERLLASMLQRGETELKGRLGKAKVQTSGSRPLHVLCDVEDLPEEFVRRTAAADLAAIKAALKEGSADLTQIAELGPGSQFLRIY